MSIEFTKQEGGKPRRDPFGLQNDEALHAFGKYGEQLNPELRTPFLFGEEKITSPDSVARIKWIDSTNSDFPKDEFRVNMESTVPDPTSEMHRIRDGLGQRVTLRDTPRAMDNPDVLDVKTFGRGNKTVLSIGGRTSKSGGFTEDERLAIIEAANKLSEINQKTSLDEGLPKPI